MSTVISFVNGKGGVGKTNLSINVAACLANLLHQKVLLIDADDQATATTWATNRGDNNSCGFRVVGMARENMAQDAMAMAADYDFTIIDAPPHAKSISRSCIIAADLVVVPIEQGGFSLWGSNWTLNQIEQAQMIKPSLKCGYVVSRKMGSTVLGREARTLAAKKGMRVFETEIEQRVAFCEAGTLYQTVFENAGVSSIAAHEILSLTQELLEVINGQELYRYTPADAAASAV